MTNINCSLDCIYQKDGKCSYTSITPSSVSSNECVYFIEKSEEKP